MKYGPIEFMDKSGRTVTLRNAEKSDAKNLIRYLRTTAGESPYLLREPEEIVLTVEQEEEFIKTMEASRRELLMVSLADGKLAGCGSINPIGGYGRYFHRCNMSVALYREYCGCGIGRTMFEKFIEAARESGYEQAELEAVSGNENAIRLYEKLGFKKYGEFPHNMKYKDGSYADAYWMMKRLK